MAVVNVRDLQRNPARVLHDLEVTRRPTFVTRNGRPVAVLMKINEEDLYDYVLANAPEYVANMCEADEAIARGDRGTPMETVFEEIEVEERARRAG
jgi:PHD/YefM family antitoxin component YafN of YafNO toxin-antitoxin module